MKVRQTEALHALAAGLDKRPATEVAALLAEAQVAAASTVAGAAAALSDAAGFMAQSIREGGVLHYAAAGSSGLMAAADAQELGGTFSIPAQQLRIHMAGGLPTGVEMPGATEDDVAGLEDLLSDLTPLDTVIAVSASGSTPFTLAAARLARQSGARVVAIANVRGAPLFEVATVGICLETPPEMVSGSTRLGAGTAQKIALNTLSTLMAMQLGHVYDGMMVNLRADNIKLRDRAEAIVSRIGDVDGKTAAAALQAAGGAVKPAVLIARLAVTPAEAEARLAATGGDLRLALDHLN